MIPKMKKKSPTVAQCSLQAHSKSLHCGVLVQKRSLPGDLEAEADEQIEARDDSHEADLRLLIHVGGVHKAHLDEPRSEAHCELTEAMEATNAQSHNRKGMLEKTGLGSAACLAESRVLLVGEDGVVIPRQLHEGLAERGPSRARFASGILQHLRTWTFPLPSGCPKNARSFFKKIHGHRRIDVCHEQIWTRLASCPDYGATVKRT